MNRIPVDSSNLASIGHNAESLVLEVEFNNGRVYQYFDVPTGTYDELMSSASKGSYMNNVIKKQFRCSQC
jgi:KTSC domain